MIKSTLPTKDARFITFDLSNFYLETPMQRPEFMRIAVTLIPKDIMDEYNLHEYAHNGYVQAGKIANDQLITFLQPHGYKECPITPGFWKHETRNIAFCLIVDDFGNKYTVIANAHHLLSVLQKNYKVSVDWKGEKYLGMALKWDYEQRICDISMPGYIEQALTCFQHPTSNTNTKTTFAT